mmetsp:Transcript_34469/g.89829  ORF Transcript_34469/g.89829 Transcript_34469/m.89829 type:complete len:709 (+) Transcript_34469:38-2164(+)
MTEPIAAIADDPRSNVRRKAIVEPGLLDDAENLASVGRRIQVAQVVDGVAYLCFATLFTILTMTLWHPGAGSLQRHLTHEFSDGESSFSAVGSANEYFDYINGTVMPTLYTDFYGAGDVPPPTHGVLPIGGGNYMSGAAQLRFLVVRPNVGCSLHDAYASAYRVCYGPWSDDAEDVAPFGPPEGGWSHSATGPGEPYSGELATYPSHGFIKLLPSNKTAGDEAIRSMKAEWGFANEASLRAAFVDVVVWNRELDLLASVRAVFEVDVTGNWIRKLEVLVVKPLDIRFDAEQDWPRYLGASCVVIFAMVYAVQEFSEMCVSGGTYLRDGWNLVDWINIALIVAATWIRFSALIEGADLIVGLSPMTDPSKHESIYGLARRAHLGRQVDAFNVILIWLKIVKYVRFVPFVHVMATLIRRSWQVIVSLTVVFATVFMGFSIAFTVGFGNQLQFLDRVPRSLTFLARSLLGDVNMTVVREAHFLLGSTMVVWFVVGVTLVLMNILRAVVFHAYCEASGSHEFRQAVTRDQEARERMAVSVAQRVSAVYRFLEIDKKLRRWTPGLYARIFVHKRQEIQKRRDREERRTQRLELEKSVLRIEAEHEKEVPVASMNAVARTIAAPKDGSDDEVVNLGPLTKVTRKGKSKYPRTTVDNMIEAARAVAYQLEKQFSEVTEDVRREARETHHVVSGIRDCIDILNRRAHDLDVQQKQL